MRELVTLVIPWTAGVSDPGCTKLLEHNLKVLSGIPILFACSENTNAGQLPEAGSDRTIYKFDPAYFENKLSFAGLLLSEAFYDSLAWNEYILLYDSGSFIVKNELKYWCKQGFDYITGPTGGVSLRRVDKFLSEARRHKREIQSLLRTGISEHEEQLYWKKKSEKFWPSVKSPGKKVAAYFGEPIDMFFASPGEKEWPFALTGLDVRSKTHFEWVKDKLL